MKIIVIGASLSGKTTLVHYLRLNGNFPVSEMDEELTKMNNGEYPLDVEYKRNVLAPRIIHDVLNQDSIIFFTNTDYFTVEDLQTARSKGFRIVLLSLGLDQLKQRNEHRVRNDGYEDVSQWFEGMLQYQNEMMKKGVVDRVIDASLPVSKITDALLK